MERQDHPLPVADRGKTGGLAQLWPHEWRRVVQELEDMPQGRTLVSRVTEAMLTHRSERPLRIRFTAKELDVVEQAWARAR